MKNRILGILRHRLGFDRAIAASTATQLIRFVTGPITMLLYLRFLTPAEQGFIYSFAGVMGIQIFLEAGFAQSITQFTSKEFAWLRFNPHGTLTGKPAALSRLRSLFHKANRYYSAMAAVLTIALGGGGYWFFISQDSYGVPWVVPWLLISLCAGIGFLLTPFWAILEGCNRVSEVSIYRFQMTLVAFVVSAIALAMREGVWVAVWGAVANLVFGFAYLAIRWRKLCFQIMRPPGTDQVSWKKEIWGFQWRTAGTWMGRYFLESGLAPLALHLHGPAAAGQVGMTFQMVRTIGGIANTWTVIRIPAWGALAARGHFDEMNQSWKLAARRNVTFCILGLGIFLIGLAGLPWVSPHYASRFLPPSATAGLVVGWMFYSVWLVAMHYTRALRSEPYTFLHFAVGVVFLPTCLLLSPTLGQNTIPWIFAAVHVPAVAIAWAILSKIRASAPRFS